jgi:predicted dehydrogenase
VVTDSSTLTVGIIGAGDVGFHHATAFAMLGPDVRVVGVADIDGGRAEDLARLCGTTPFVDYRDMLELSPDICVICLPHHLHREAGLAAADRGSHILMEKPMGSTLDDAREIVDGCRKQNVRLGVGFVHRYRTEFQFAKRLVSDGLIGTPAIATDRFRTRGGKQVPPWVWEKSKAGGGVLMYTGIHSIDRMRWLLNSEVREVSARIRTYSQDVDVEDCLIATIEFENGCLATLFENAPDFSVVPRAWDFELYGAAGWIQVSHGKSLEFGSDDQSYRLDIAHDNCFLSQARDFVKSVQTGRDPWITGEDGLRAFQVAAALYRAAETNCSVLIDSVD